MPPTTHLLGVELVQQPQKIDGLCKLYSFRVYKLTVGMGGKRTTRLSSLASPTDSHLKLERSLDLEMFGGELGELRLENWRCLKNKTGNGEKIEIHVVSIFSHLFLSI